jgi:hypothetical protein
MFDSVLSARDRWLSDSGIMAPSRTKILLSAFGDSEWYNDTVNFWSNVYGFKMNTMTIDFKKNAMVTIVDGSKLISDTVVLLDTDTKTVSVSELDFISKFEIKITTDGKIYAFCGWFDTLFEARGIEPIMFSTSPKSKSTHWQQTMFILNDPLDVRSEDIITGTFSCKKSVHNLRELDVIMEYSVKGQEKTFRQHFGIV